MRHCSYHGEWPYSLVHLMQKQLVIFDLDGTLLNTIADLAAATNHALNTCNYAEHPIAAYHTFVGNGITKLIERALPPQARTEAEIQHVRNRFVTYYNVHCTDLTQPYDGINTLLHHLQDNGVAVAVASNKYQQATEQIIAHFFPKIRFAAVLGQRNGIPTKPDPTIVHEIMGCRYKAAQTLFVGDSDVDMQTAANAGVEAVGVTWGFRTVAELQRFHPKHIVHRPEEIFEFCV